MDRTTRISGFLSLLRATTAAAIFGGVILSCADSATAPSNALSPRNPALAGVQIVRFQVADAIKHSGPLHASNNLIGGAPHISRDATVAPTPSIYTVSTVPFAPEPAPAIPLMPDPLSPEPNCDDCVAYHVPIGFDFTFYGNSYSQIQISSNGLVRLGSDQSLLDGCCWGGEIPLDDRYNNIIAVAWTDLVPVAPGGITFETQGTAPHRKFVVQWTDVVETRDPFPMVPGHVTAQLVLAEGSNDITIYTTSMDFTGDFRFVTQGIENADGTEAAFLPGRVQAKFGLTNDAVRFKIRSLTKPIVLVAPPNLELGMDARACFNSTVSVGQPTVSGGGDGLTVSGHRNDGLALTDAYPQGVTTITWTATDAEGTTELATQTVTIADHEAPVVTAPAGITANNDPGLGTAFVHVGAAGLAQVSDNCPNFSVGDAPDGVFPVGTTNAVWTATDAAGNVGTALQPVTVKDVEAPTIEMPSALTVNATSPAGAKVNFNSFGHDNVAVTSFSCDKVSGTNFPIGTTTVSCSALDAAGNRSAPATLTVTVLGAPEQIVNLMESLRGVPIREELREQLVNALTASLRNDRNSRATCQALTMFAGIVKARTPSVFSVEKSAQLLADVARIQRVIGCSNDDNNNNDNHTEHSQFKRSTGFNRRGR